MTTEYLGGSVQVVGEYKLKLSNSDDCQILGTGKWKTVDGIIDGRGEISVCTNYNPDFYTYIAVATMTGNVALID